MARKRIVVVNDDSLLSKTMQKSWWGVDLLLVHDTLRQRKGRGGAMKSIDRIYKELIEVLGKPKQLPVPVPVRVRD